MTIDDLKSLAARLVKGPVPTQAKKLYTYIGSFQSLQDALSGLAIIHSSVLNAFDSQELPEQESALARLIQQQLTEHIEKLREGRNSSVLVLKDAILLPRYGVPLTFLYSLVGDAHAIILHCARSASPKGWRPPSYVHFDPVRGAKFFEDSLAGQCIYQAETED